jgi:type IV secretory pathway TraG/TraD family ATPase VirD4
MHVLNIGIVRKMIAGDTTITPDVMEERKWILVNMPITPGDASATVVNAAMKYVVQRHILRRKATEKSPLLTIWIDEYQKTGNSFDALALAEIRSHKGCMVVLTQSMHALYSSIRQHGGDHETDSLLTNFGHIIFHTLGDAKSAEYASSLLGQRRELFVGASSTNASMWDVVTGKSGISVNTSETYQPVLQPSAFLSGLRHGGPPHRIVDGIVIKTGEPFHSGENYIFCEFKQK